MARVTVVSAHPWPLAAPGDRAQPGERLRVLGALRLLHLPFCLVALGLGGGGGRGRRYLGSGATWGSSWHLATIHSECTARGEGGGASPSHPWARRTDVFLDVPVGWLDCKDWVLRQADVGMMGAGF